MEKFLAQWMPVDASEHGPYLDRLSANVHWLMLILFIGWGLFFVYSLWRFNAKRNPKASYHGVQSHFSTYTEAGVAVDDLSLEAVEAILIRKALARTQGNVSHAAEALGLSRGALYRRIEKYGL